MITLPLRMRYGEKPLRQAAAWLIPGAEPRIWLDEMLAWGVSLGDAALYPLPRSAGDLSPQGVLVVLPAGLAPRTTHRSQPYAALVVPHSALVVPPLGGSSGEIPPKGGTTSAAHVVYLPVEARFDPDASDAEVALLAADQGDCILHPTAGRIGLEAGDRRRIVDLLVAPPQRPARWDLAEPGQRVNSRLTAILPAEVLSVQDMLDQGRDDIGSEAPDLQEEEIGSESADLADEELDPDHPPQGSKPSPGALGKLGRAVQRALSQMMRSMEQALDKMKSKRARAAKKPKPARPQEREGQGKAAAGRPAKPGLVSNMLGRVWQALTRISESLRQQRFRELRRLMDLLQKDPDKGLRFALPCDAARHRYGGPPGAKLPERNVNFELRRLGGGGVVDPWELPGGFYSQLRAKYMELAGREMRLGRYRRAAYIYAHLLGDLTNAAAALMAGKHWRESAALYRDRLKRPEMAARCLEQGGLWAEAIEYYEELGDFEKVGDLHAQLEQPQEAEKAWRRAVAKHLERRDSIAAARVLETKLKVPDEALQVLAAAWPGSSQAGHCLAEQFALLGRLGRHDAAEHLVAQLRQQQLNEAVRSRAIDVLGETAVHYPQETVRHAAADATRTIVARHLREASGLELDHLLEALRRLAPADRLLERDTARYLRIRTQPPRAAAKAVARTARRTVVPAPHLATELKRLESIQLPKNVAWQRAVSCGDHFYAAGYGEPNLWLVQSSWTGKHRIQKRNLAEVRPLLVAFDRGSRDETSVLHLVGGPRVPMIALVASDIVLRNSFAGSPGWLPENAVAVAFSASGAKHVLAPTDDGLVLHTLDANAVPLRSQLITYASLWPDEGTSAPPVVPAPICSSDRGVYLGLGDRLVLVAEERSPQVFPMPGSVQSLCGSTPFSVPRMVATFEQGAGLFWEEDQTVVRFADALDHPLAAFTAGGWIALASSDELHVYKTEGRTIQLAARQKREGRPIAVLATAHPHGFAIVGEDGVVEQFQMHRR